MERLRAGIFSYKNHNNLSLKYASSGCYFHRNSDHSLDLSSPCYPTIDKWSSLYPHFKVPPEKNQPPPDPPPPATPAARDNVVSAGKTSSGPLSPYDAPVANCIPVETDGDMVAGAMKSRVACSQNTHPWERIKLSSSLTVRRCKLPSLEPSTF